MENINKLFDKLDAVTAESQVKVEDMRDAIQKELNTTYRDWKELQDAVSKLSNQVGVEYCTNEYGDVEAWTRFYPLADVPRREREFLETYLGTVVGSVFVDWENDTLTQCVGGDEILIREDNWPHGGGVYQSGKQIIAEADYTDDDGDVNEDLRNELIEKHMERTGYFPGVYLTNNHDNHLIPVDTTKRKD